MRIQVVSDLHLELRDRAHGHRADGDGDFPASAPYLALLGDVGDPGSAAYGEFLARQAARFRRVFVVLGNHECYGRGVREALALARGAAAGLPGVTVLERESVDVDGVRVLGTTLWSDVDYQTACYMQDFRSIDGWSLATARAEHAACAAWLARELSRDVPTVVLTHHAPLTGFTSAPRHAGSPFESGFATDLGHLVRRPGVLAWFHGHTHWSHATRVGRPGGGRQVLVAANAAGLAGEDTRFDPAAVFDVVA